MDERLGTFVIASDSMSVLMALERNDIVATSSMALFKCIYDPYMLSQLHYRVILIWIANEQVDKMAKEAVIISHGILLTEEPERRSHIGPMKNRLKM